MNVYRVGDLYTPSRTHWEEGVDYNFRSGAHELRLFFTSPSSREVDAVRKGPAEFAFLVKGEVIVFLFRFGDAVPWSDKPFSYWLVPENERVPPSAADEPHDILSIILVDAANGRIRVLRTVSFSPAFTTALRLAIRDQAERPWPADYDAQVARIYAQYPTSIDMVKDATARTMGGR